MTTNVTVFPVDGPAVLYFQDGTTMNLEPQQEKSVQIIEGGICTISDPFDDQHDEEHFIKMMIQFWKDMLATLHPTATPYGVNVEEQGDIDA